jgi:hypothetical protein
VPIIARTTNGAARLSLEQSPRSATQYIGVDCADAHPCEAVGARRRDVPVAAKRLATGKWLPQAIR